MEKTKFNRIISLSHDFGKLTSFFEDKLFNRLDEKDKEKSFHSYISALFTYYLLKEEGFSEKDSLFGYIIVYNHHSHIRGYDIMFEKVFEDDRKYKIIKAQIEDMLKPENKKKIENMFKNEGFCINLDDFANLILETSSNEAMKLSKQLYKMHKNIVIPNIREFHQKIIAYMPKFIKADRYSAMDLKNIDINSGLVYDDLLEYVKNKNKSFKPKNELQAKMNYLRMVMTETAIDSLLRTDIEKNKIMSLNIFTGGGKTLISYLVALKLKELKQKKNGCNSRIITGIPFVSIISQTYKELDEVLREYVPDYDKNKSKYLIDSFYLADSRYVNTDLEFNEDDLSTQKVIKDNFESDMVITTFVQLFESMFSNINSNLAKLENLKNSIIILDEIQSINPLLWTLIEKIITFYAENYNIHFIVMTATKPKILENNTVVLADFGYMALPASRLKLMYIEELLTVKGLAKKIKSINREKKRNSILVILNTRGQVQELYDELKDDFNEYEIFLLSNSSTPKELKERIETIKSLIKEEKKVLILSTQLIETGVDMSVEVIFRDIAGIDNILQAAGRASRNFDTKYMAEFYVVNLLNDYNLSSAEYIYSKEVIGITRDILEKSVLAKGFLEDKQDFDDLIKEYFIQIDELTKNLQIAIKNKLWNGFEKFNSEVMKEFKLIKDTKKINLFIEIDNKATKIYKMYKDLVFNEKNLKVKRNNYLKIKKDFNQYVVSLYESSMDKFSINLYIDELIENSRCKNEKVADILSVPKGLIGIVYDDSKGCGKGLIRA